MSRSFVVKKKMVLTSFFAASDYVRFKFPFRHFLAFVGRKGMSNCALHSNWCVNFFISSGCKFTFVKLFFSRMVVYRYLKVLEAGSEFPPVNDFRVIKTTWIKWEWKRKKHHLSSQTGLEKLHSALAISSSVGEQLLIRFSFMRSKGAKFSK